MWELYALTHEAEIKQTEDQIIAFVAQKTGFSEAKVRQVYEGACFALTTGNLVRGGIKATAKVGAKVGANALKKSLKEEVKAQPKGEVKIPEGKREVKSTKKDKNNSPVDGKLYQDHHIISDKNKWTKEHPLWEKAGMKPDSLDNKMFLPNNKGAEVSTTQRSIHQGKHVDLVSENLGKQMNRELERGKRNNWTQEQYAKALKDIISDERQVLKSGERMLNKNHRPWAKDLPKK